MSQQYPLPGQILVSGETPGLTPATAATPGLPTTATAAAPAQPSLTTGAIPGQSTLTAEAPPDYTDIYKQEHQPQFQPPPQSFPAQFIPVQQPAMHSVIQPVQYMMPAPMQMVAVTPRPNYPGPHDFLILAIVVASICALLNPTSLVFGIAATVLAVTSKGQKDAANYPSAKSYATAALALIICDIVYTLVMAILGIGLTIGLVYRFVYCCYYYYWQWANPTVLFS